MNDILSSYNSYTTEVKRMNEQKREIENIRKAHLTVVPTSPALIALHEKFLQDLNQQLEQLRTPVKPKLVTFACDKKRLLTEVNKLCKLIERVSEIDYESKTQSIISVCDKLYKDNNFILDGTNPCLHLYNNDLVLQKDVVTRGEGQQVINPYFFFIDKFGDILITDYDSNSILILNSEFEFIHKSLLTDRRELPWMKYIGLLLLVVLLNVYRYSNTLENISNFYYPIIFYLSSFNIF